MPIHQSVPNREGVTLSLWIDRGLVSAVVMLARNGNTVQRLFEGPDLVRGLQEADAASQRHGFSGLYEIAGLDVVDAMTAQDVRSQPGVVSELTRQIDAFRPNVGTPAGFEPWSPDAVAIVMAQAHLSRLMDLRAAFTRRLAA
jgi:hypothetical protein